MSKKLIPNLKPLLKEKGITQRELAERIKYRKSGLSEFANNKLEHYPKVLLEGIMNELNVSIGELFVVEEESKEKATQ